MNKILVVGSTGVIGDAIVKHCSKHAIAVVGLSRTAGTTGDKHVNYITVDLTNKDSTNKITKELQDITEVIYAAFIAKENNQEQNEINNLMFSNVMNFIVPSLPKLKRVVLIEGVKSYGVHLGPFKTPAVETDPRPIDSVFYFYQEDLLKEMQTGKPWSWTVIRPDAVCGTTAGFPMNIALLVAVYASICKELGLPLKFPGSYGGYKALAQVTDSNLLAEAIIWSALNENCKSQIINVTNGDLFRWENLWPNIAKFFDMETGPQQKIMLSDQMPLKGAVWETMIKKYQLKKIPLDKIVAWGFGDFLLNCDYDVISSVNHLRKLGFHKFVDTEEMFLNIFQKFRQNKVIP